MHLAPAIICLALWFSVSRAHRSVFSSPAVLHHSQRHARRQYETAGGLRKEDWSNSNVKYEKHVNKQNNKKLRLLICDYVTTTHCSQHTITCRLETRSERIFFVIASAVVFHLISKAHSREIQQFHTLLCPNITLSSPPSETGVA